MENRKRVTVRFRVVRPYTHTTLPRVNTAKYSQLWENRIPEAIAFDLAGEHGNHEASDVLTKSPIPSLKYRAEKQILSKLQYVSGITHWFYHGTDLKMRTHRRE